MVKKIYYLGIILSLAFIVGCSGGDTSGGTGGGDGGTGGNGGTGGDNGGNGGVDWRDVSLTDIATGDSFKVSDFSDKPVLLESFAVWCPTCTKQQNSIKELHEDIGDAVVSISLNTDPNEDESRVRKHIEDKGFDWYYAVAPSAMTNSLIDEFGIAFVNAPTAPIILICPDGTATFLRRGVKSAEELKSLVEGC